MTRNILGQTPSQTVGPFFAYALTPEQYGYAFCSVASNSPVGEDTPGERIRLLGRVFDGDGAVVDDALLEIWQADANGAYAHPEAPGDPAPGFTGFARVGTGADPENRFIFETVKPGPAEDGAAPVINVIVMMRGLLKHAYTRIYFSDEADANAADPVLARVPTDRRQSLIAERREKPWGADYLFDIHMQGKHETVFFEM